MKQSFAGFLIAALIIVSPALAAAEPSPVAAAEPSAEMQKLSRTRALVETRQAGHENPWKEETPAQGGSVLAAIEGLALCVGLFLVGVHFYRKMSGSRPLVPGKRMRVIERMGITTKTSLALVEVEGQRMLIALTPERATIHPLEAPMEQLYKESLVQGCSPEEFNA